jgi:hypothetical protein
VSPEAFSPLGAYRLKEWPFREVPEPTRCTFIAGRPNLLSTLDRLLVSSGNPVSAIYLFWASLGAGKTHALYYLMNKMDSPELFLPIYSEYPESPASFVEIYGKLARNIPWDRIADFCFQLFAGADDATSKSLGQIRLVQPDIYRAFFLLSEGEDRGKAKLANRWFRGEQLSRTELREAALANNLHAPGDCAGVISILAKLLGLKQQTAPSGTPPFRLVWIIDECQRLENASKRINQEVNAGLQSTFNSTPDHLTLILSFTGRPEKGFPDWLRPELADRIGARNVILLPPLSRDAARGFLLELLDHYRTTGQSVERFFPFTEKAVDYMIGRLLKADVNAFGLGSLVEKEGIRPRALIKCCGAVLQEHVDKQLPLPIDERFVATVIPK